MTNHAWDELAELRRKWLALEGDDAVELHGWLIGVAIAIERKRGADPAEGDLLLAELRASVSPDAREIPAEFGIEEKTNG